VSPEIGQAIPSHFKTARHELEISSGRKFMQVFASEFITHNNFTGHENRLMKNLEAKSTRGLILAEYLLFLDQEIPHGLNRIRHYWRPFRESDRSR
jgi:hypothetical protein